MPELTAYFGVGFRVDEMDDALPRRLMLRRVHAGASRRNAPLRADAGHLDEDKAGAALGALAVMHEMPVRGAAVDRLVLVHGRDHDAILQRHVAELERREHRPPYVRAVAAGTALEPGLGALQPRA